MFIRPIAFWLALMTATATAASADTINFRQYSGHFASAGQPSGEQLA